MAFNKSEYNTTFNKSHYDRLVVNIQKGKLQEMKEFAEAQEQTVADLVVNAIWKCYKINLRERPAIKE